MVVGKIKCVSILFLFCIVQIAFAGSDEVIFKGTILEYIKPLELEIDTSKEAEKEEKKLKPTKPKPIKGILASIYTDKGDYYSEKEIKNGTFVLKLPRGQIFNILFTKESFDPLVVVFNTENVKVTSEEGWQEYQMTFEMLEDIPDSVPLTIPMIEWNSSANRYSEVSIKLSDTNHLAYLRKMIREDLTAAASVVTKLIDKYFNGDTKKNKLKLEHYRREVSGQLPIKVQMKRTLSQYKNKFEGLELKSQIIEVEMEATDVKVAFSQDPVIDSILQLRKPQIQAYVKKLTADYNLTKIEYERMLKAFQAYISAENAKKGNDLVASVENFYPDSIPSHFHPELLALLSKFRAETNEDIIALQDPNYFKKFGGGTSNINESRSILEGPANRRIDQNASDKYGNQNKYSENFTSSQYNSQNEISKPSMEYDGDFFNPTEPIYTNEGEYSDEIVANNPSIVKNRDYESKLQQYIKRQYGEEAAENIRWNSNSNYGKENIDFSNKRSQSYPSKSTSSNESSEFQNNSENNKELYAEKIAYSSNEFSRIFRQNFQNEFLASTSSLKDSSFGENFQQSWKIVFEQSFSQAFNQELPDEFMLKFEESFEAPSTFENSAKFGILFTERFLSSFADAYSASFGQTCHPSFKKKFNALFNRMLQITEPEDAAKSFEEPFTIAFEKAFKEQIPDLVAALDKSSYLLENGTGNALITANVKTLEQKQKYAMEIFTKEFPINFEENFTSRPSKFDDGTFQSQFENTFLEQFTALFEKAFQQAIPVDFLEIFREKYRDGIDNIKPSDNFATEFSKTFSTTFQEAYLEAFQEKLPASFKEQFTTTFTSLFLGTISQDQFNENFSSAFKPSFGSAFETVIENLTKIVYANQEESVASNFKESRLFSNSTANKSYKKDGEYSPTPLQQSNVKIINQKVHERLKQINQESKKAFEETFFMNFSNEFSSQASVNFDDTFSEVFENVFTKTFSSAHEAAFKSNTPEAFTSLMKTRINEAMSSYNDPSLFKTSFRKNFTAIFMETYKEVFKTTIPDEFRLSFNRSFNELMIMDDKMPFNQLFERAFTPAFEESFNKAIPAINYALNGSAIKEKLMKDEAAKAVAGIEAAAASQEKDFINYRDQSKELQSTKKKQKMKLTVADNLGGKISNPNQQFHDSNSTKAFIDNLRSEYNPVERYSFMIDKTEIIVTKYRTPDGVFEVLSDQSNRIQMLKNNIIVTENVFGSEQQKYYKKLEKLSNYEFRNDQITQIKYTAKKGLLFRVQVGALSKSDIKIFNPLKIYGDLTIDKQGSIYKYMIGEFTSLNKLTDTKAQIKMSIPDAFSVCYYYGQRIHMKHALQILLGNPQYTK